MTDGDTVRCAVSAVAIRGDGGGRLDRLGGGRRGHSYLCDKLLKGFTRAGERLNLGQIAVTDPLVSPNESAFPRSYLALFCDHAAALVALRVGFRGSS